jgi:hypothetical protein
MKINKSTVVLVTISFLVSSMVFLLPAHGETGKKQIEVTYRNIGIQVNGEEIGSEQEPFLFQDRVYASLRTIGEAVDKKVTWDNETSKVLIKDSPTNSKFDSDTFCFPIHMIEERVERFPYVVTINRVFIEELEEVEGEEIRIDLRFENISDKFLGLQAARPFTLWDKNGNMLAFLWQRGLSSFEFPPHYDSKEKTPWAYLCVTLTDELKEQIRNKDVLLMFIPIAKQASVEFTNALLVFDLGVIVKE